jgi:hypothetical protein
MSARIFVGTLACGEAERDECRAAVAAQTGVVVTHQMIEGLPELEAHNALWEAWSKVRTSHDLFVKIDADTILIRTTALAEIAALFADPEVTGAQILLHDYFTNRLIAGLNAFSGKVAFKAGTDRLFTDRVDTGHKKVLKGEAVQYLAPIGWHCRNPHPRQAFHFGLHRAYKKQMEVVARTAAVWLEKHDTGREWALAGAMSAGWRLRRHFDYRDARFEAAFQALQNDTARTARIEAFARRAARGA